jgi:hypothetical protein
MSGYVASARVRGVPRLVRANPAVERSIAFGPSDDLAAVEVDEVDGDGGRTFERVVGRLAERGAAFRERWSQLTFYLLDPNSWR